MTERGRLLVVEDEPDIRELLCAGLRFAGFAVSSAATGSEALDAARTGAPDLVLLDVMLPDHARQCGRPRHRPHDRARDRRGTGGGALVADRAGHRTG